MPIVAIDGDHRVLPAEQHLRREQEDERQRHRARRRLVQRHRVQLGARWRPPRTAARRSAPPASASILAIPTTAASTTGTEAAMTAACTGGASADTTAPGEVVTSLTISSRIDPPMGRLRCAIATRDAPRSGWIALVPAPVACFGGPGSGSVACVPPEVKLSSADRVLFPDDGITKGDLFAYYDRVADAIVPHLHDRPVHDEALARGRAGRVRSSRSRRRRACPTGSRRASSGPSSATARRRGWSTSRS